MVDKVKEILLWVTYAGVIMGLIGLVGNTRSTKYVGVVGFFVSFMSFFAFTALSQMESNQLTIDLTLLLLSVLVLAKPEKNTEDKT